MNRLEYINARLNSDEAFVSKERSIKLYDGDEKTSYEDGEALLTTHRLFWGLPGEIARGARVLCLHLHYVMSLDEEIASNFLFSKKKRIIMHLKSPIPNKQPGPMDRSTTSFIKISGRTGIDPGFINALRETVAARIWEVGQNAEQQNPDSPKIKLRTGIAGIERNIQERQRNTDDTINLAFQDLSKLMGMAKDMVGVSKVISQKIRERQGDISEDETVRFKSYLLSLGIDDPVTRDSYQSNNEYYSNLGKQICEMLLDPIMEIGGMMALTEVYCRVNRARGLELLSPEDLLNACKILNGPLKLRQFPSGAMVLQLDTHDDEAVAEETAGQVEEAKSISIEELARLKKIPILLAQERLYTAERIGKICRDESIEGLRFYPNLFLQNAC